jgi:hypothetical protein
MMCSAEAVHTKMCGLWLLLSMSTESWWHSVAKDEPRNSCLNIDRFRMEV